MKSLHEFNQKTRFVLTDIDDTITTKGQLSDKAYSALWNLKQNNFFVIPVTGRPAGWCDMIARFWPVDTVIGENGGLYYRYHQNKMIRWNFHSETEIEKNKKKLELIKNEVLKEIPKARVSADQFSRVHDLAIDFCEDIPKLTESDIQKIVSLFKKHGATAKVSSIHVNGWFGDFNKVTTAKLVLKKEFGLDDQQILDQCVYIGDSPNDEPLFENFRHTFGVANIKEFSSKMKHLPQYISSLDSGDGFCEIVEKIISSK